MQIATLTRKNTRGVTEPRKKEQATSSSVGIVAGLLSAAQRRTVLSIFAEFVDEVPVSILAEFGELRSDGS